MKYNAITTSLFKDTFDFYRGGGMEINMHNLNIFKNKPQLLEKA
jgi:hypothetical protein